jgi:TRAP-type uncharacterized transport system substrate-binding protein/ABC-type amino acid transport system permease subunit
MSFLPLGFIGDFLSGFVTNLWIAAASLLLGLAAGGILALLRLRRGVVGRFASAATSLCDAVPTFVAMFVLLNMLPASIAAGGYSLAVPSAGFVILTLGIHAASNISSSLPDAIRSYRAGAKGAALLFIPDATRLFVVLLLGSSIGAAIGVPDAVTATLRHADLLPDMKSRVILVIVALAMFMLLVQALEALLRVANALLIAIVLPSAATGDADGANGRRWYLDIDSHLRFLANHRVLFVISTGIVVALVYGAPTPPRVVDIATGARGGSWSAVAEKYRPIFAAQGIELRPVAFQDTASIPAAVSSDDSAVSMGFAIAEIEANEAENLRTLGAIEYQPLFVFYRKALGKDWTVENLRGRSIALPPAGSATVALTVPVLNALDIDGTNTKLSYMPLADQIVAIKAGAVDAIAFVLRDDNPLVRELMLRDDLQIVDFPQAYAISVRFPQLRPVKLARDVIDMAKHIPAREVSLVAGTSYIVVNKSLHPAIVWTMLRAMTTVHGPATLVSAEREFPALRHTKVEIDPRAAEFYTSGVPWGYRQLPLQWASTVEYYLAIVLPLALLLPIYRWLGLPDVPDLLNMLRLALWHRALTQIEKDVARTGRWTRSNHTTLNVIHQAVLRPDGSSHVKGLIAKLEQHRTPPIEKAD